MIELLRKFLFSGLGVVAFTKSQLDALVKELVSKGEMSEEEGKKIVEEFTKRMELKKEEMLSTIRQEIGKLFDVVDVPSKAEVNEIKRMLKALENRVELLEGIVTEIKKGG
ncbi:MAG: hypothetical protein J7L41_06220 [Synergistetes bacterium]|nr:hypothetical protein [Synergistota bacterium]